MIRWKYVLPRLGMLAIVAGVLGLFMDSLLRRALIYSGQAALGSRVEIGRFDTSLLRGRIEIERLVVADPERALKNIVQAERAVFDLDVSAALRKKFIVHDGVIDGLTLYTDRQATGILDQDPSDDPTDKSTVSTAVEALGERGEAWVDGMLGNFETEFENELQTVQLADELKQRWPAQYEQLVSDAKRIETQGRQLQEQIKAIADDPLQHLDQVPAALGAVDALKKDALQVKSQVTQWQHQIQQDKLALDQARQHDVEYVRERLRLDDLDPDALSEYLLGPVWSERVELAIRWIQRSRQLTAAPAGENDDPGDQPRGINVLFPGFPASADVLVRRLRLLGGGTVDGKPYDFTATVRDLTHQPHRHAQPAVIDVQSKGAVQMIAQGTLDRRSAHPVDRFQVQLPSVRQHGQRLGKPDKLAVQISPGHARIVADVYVRDEQLDGTISLRQDDLKLDPQLPKKYERYITPENLQAAVAGVQHLDVTVTLSGKLTRPEYRMKSNLGPQLAQGLNRAVGQELAKRQEQLMQVAHQQVDQQLSELQDDLVAEHGDVLKQLELGTDQLDQFKRKLTAGLGSPGDLLSRGRKLFK